MIGTFYQPEFIFYDISTLLTLPRNQVYAGFAEIILHGIIKEPDFLEWLYENRINLLALKEEYITEAIVRSCKIKIDVVTKDEFDKGIRAILNFGHTFAHALESLSNYKLSHGMAVAIGMVLATAVSEELGYCENLTNKVENILREFNLPVRIPSFIDIGEIVNTMKYDKKNTNHQINLILIEKFGNVFKCDNVSSKSIEKVLGRYVEEC
ncbi:3-dehydroquinate synthase family protein [Bacillus cereus]